METNAVEYENIDASCTATFVIGQVFLKIRKTFVIYKIIS